MKRIRALRPWLPAIPSAAFCAGLAVRFTVKDHLQVVSLVYYGTPTIVLAVLAAFAALGWWRRSRRPAAAVFAAAAVACGIWWHQVCFFGPPETASPDDAAPVRLVCWNPAHGRLGWPGIVDAARLHDPDIIALVEADDKQGESPDVWRRAFPEHDGTQLFEGLLLLVRGDIDFVEHGHLDPGRYCRVRLSTSAGTMNVVVVDIVNHVLQDRAVPMAKLRDVTAPCDGEPLLVVGDFNTPADSVHFQPLRGELLNAFEAAGAGYAPTWPVPLPVVQIDHVWANRHVVLHNCRQQSTLRSDHRMVIVDFSLSP